MQLNGRFSNIFFSSFICRKRKEYRYPLLAGLIVGFLAHFSAFANKLINYDDVFYLFAKGATADSGRWGLDLLSFLFPDFSMPWIYGVITLVLMTSAGCIMLRILGIRSKLLQVLLMCLLITYPSLTSLYTYMFTSSSYGLAFLLAVLSVYQMLFASSWKRLLALPMLIFSLSIYQPYFAVAASLLVIYLIKQILTEDISGRKIWISGLSYIAFLTISLVLYYLSIHIVFALFDIRFNGYANENLSLDVKTLFSRLIDAYYTFIYFFTRGYNGILNTLWIRSLHFFLLVLGGIAIIPWFFHRLSISKALPLLFCLGVFPLSINCMYLIAHPQAITTLVVHSFVNLYFLLAVLFECSIPERSHYNISFYFSNLCRQIRSTVLPFCLLVIIISNVYLANEVYLKVQLAYENTYAFYSALSGKIIDHPAFDENTKIAIVGDPRENPALHSVEEAEEFEDIAITGAHGMRITSYSAEQFVKYYIGLNIPFAGKDEIKELAHTEAFQSMSDYPYYGCIQKIDDYLVVRLSDPNAPS